jgi:AcrR family transcriptional regulator
VIAVAERAGLSAGALYRHFPSKAELFTELFRQVCDREIAAMRTAADEVAASDVARIEAVLTTFAQRALRNPRLAWALLAEPVDAAVDAERLAYRRRYADLLAGQLAEAIRAGELPDQDVGFTAAALVGGLGEALVGPLSTANGSRNPADVVTQIRIFVRRALGAPATP